MKIENGINRITMVLTKDEAKAIIANLQRSLDHAEEVGGSWYSQPTKVIVDSQSIEGRFKLVIEE